jgi:DNA-binding NtrC family response regulator
MHYRLRGVVGGAVRTYALASGENRIGSVRGNEIVLPVRGVSRRHAVVRLDDGEVKIEDLGSKNGTLVNRVRVESTRLQPGDEVRFGPVMLQLEPVDAEDAELGLAFPQGEPAPVSGFSTADTTGVPGEGDQAGAWLGVIETVLARLAVVPEADVAGALGALVSELPARGACVVEWGPDGEAIVVAAAGQIETPLEHAGFQSFVERALRQAQPGDVVTAILSGEPVLSCALLSGPGRERLALVIWGPFENRGASEPLLRILLRLLDRFRPRPVHVPGAAPRSPRHGLQFPEAYVPGDSPAMASLYGQMQPLVQGDLPVLILGETGVGKEYLAQILHDSSPRRKGPFVAINCAAIPADLLESEMFGIGKGVATGVVERQGKFQLAEGGTLFLDEIGDMSLDLQAKLLRALQEKEIHPVGSPRPVAVDIRVVAATNSDLLERVEGGRFRRDLYYRVAGYALRVPPLRERKQDIPALVESFIHAFSREAGKSIRGVTVKALRALVGYTWPGNIRELQHEVRRLVYLCAPGQAIDSMMLSDNVAAGAPRDVPAGAPAEAASAEDGSLSIEAHVDRLESRLIREALNRAGGNRSQAAKLLGISRNGLAIKIERLGIKD